MEKITSFTIDHLKLVPGLYVSRKDCAGEQVITTFARMYSSLQHHRYRDAMRTTSHSRRTCASNFRTTSAQKKVHLLSHYQ